MKFGFELEAFCLSVDTDMPVLIPDGLPYDECGWLVEIRSDPFTNPYKAVHLLEAEKFLVERKAAKAGVRLEYISLREIPRDLKVQAARSHTKGLISYQNVYGFETHRNSTKLQTASLHVSFTNEVQWHYTGRDNLSGIHTYNGFVDHAKLIVGLDWAFKAEIKAAKRNPGFYEIKTDGRIEYRSLPNTVDLMKVAEVLEKLTK